MAHICIFYMHMNYMTKHSYLFESKAFQLEVYKHGRLWMNYCSRCNNKSLTPTGAYNVYHNKTLGVATSLSSKRTHTHTHNEKSGMVDTCCHNRGDNPSWFWCDDRSIARDLPTQSAPRCFSWHERRVRSGGNKQQTLECARACVRHKYTADDLNGLWCKYKFIFE